MGNENFPKEQMDMYFDGKMILLNDYKELSFFGINEKNLKSSIQDKGHYNELKVFGRYLKGKKDAEIIPLWQLIGATEISFKVDKQIKEN